MNTKGIKFLAVLAVLAMAFAAFAVVSETTDDSDAATREVADVTKVGSGTVALKVETAEGADYDKSAADASEQNIYVLTTPDDHYELTSITYTLAGGEPVNITATHIIPAAETEITAINVTFTQIEYQVTITAPGVGEGTLVLYDEAWDLLATGDWVEAGSTVNVEAVAGDGYYLRSITVNGEAISLDLMTFEMPSAAATVAANYVHEYTLTYPDSDGATYVAMVGEEVIENGGTIFEGDELVITITPADGKYLRVVKNNAIPVAATNVGEIAESYVLSINPVANNVTITSTWGDTVNVTVPSVESITHGTLTVSVDGDPLAAGETTEIIKGKTVAIEGTPDVGYVLSWSVNEVAKVGDNFVATSDSVIGAEFVLIPYDIAEQTAPANTEVTIEIQRQGAGDFIEITNYTTTKINNGDVLRITVEPVVGYDIGDLDITQLTGSDGVHDLTADATYEGTGYRGTLELGAYNIVDGIVSTGAANHTEFTITVPVADTYTVTKDPAAGPYYYGADITLTVAKTGNNKVTEITTTIEGATVNLTLGTITFSMPYSNITADMIEVTTVPLYAITAAAGDTGYTSATYSADSVAYTLGQYTLKAGDVVTMTIVTTGANVNVKQVAIIGTTTTYADVEGNVATITMPAENVTLQVTTEATFTVKFADGITVKNGAETITSEVTKVFPDTELTVEVDVGEKQILTKLTYTNIYGIDVEIDISGESFVFDMPAANTTVKATIVDAYTITWADGDNYSISVIAGSAVAVKDALVPKNTMITVTVVTNNGYIQDGVKEGSTPFTSGLPFALTADADIQPNVVGNKMVSVTAPQNGNISLNDGAILSGMNVKEGTEITIVATPNENYELVKITVNGNEIEEVSGVYTYTMLDSNAVIAATFAPEKKTILVDLDSLGEIPAGVAVNIIGATKAGEDYEAPYGSTIVVSVTLGTMTLDSLSYTLVTSGVKTELNNGGSIIVSDEIEIHAFVNQYYTVNITAPVNGTIELTAGDEVIVPGQKVLAGTEILVTAEPASENYILDKITGVVLDDEDMFELEGNVTVSAIFKPVDKAITVLVNGEEEIPAGIKVTISGATKTEYGYVASYGSTVIVNFTFGTMTLDSLTYTIKGGDAQDLNNGGSIIVSDDILIEAEIYQYYTVNITAPANGTIELKAGDEVIVSGDKVLAGTVITVTAEPASDNYVFDKYTGVEVVDGKFTLTKDVTVSAVFKPVDKEIIILINGEEEIPEVVKVTVNGATKTEGGYVAAYDSTISVVIDAGAMTLETITYSIGGAEPVKYVNGAAVVVSGDIVFDAEVKQYYTITWSAQPNITSITVTYGGAAVTSGQKVEADAEKEVVIDFEAADGFIVKTTKVTMNGGDVPFTKGDGFALTGNITAITISGEVEPNKYTVAWDNEYIVSVNDTVAAKGQIEVYEEASKITVVVNPQGQILTGVKYKIGNTDYNATAVAGKDNTYEFNATGNVVSITPQIVEDAYKINYDVTSGGVAIAGTTVTFTSDGTTKDYAVAGKTVTVSIVPATGYKVSEVTVVGIGDITKNLRFVMPEGEAMVHVVLEADYEDLSGKITTDRTLGADSIVTGDVTIEKGVTLTVPAGKTLNLNGWTVKVYGDLVIEEGAVVINEKVNKAPAEDFKGYIMVEPKDGDLVNSGVIGAGLNAVTIGMIEPGEDDDYLVDLSAVRLNNVAGLVIEFDVVDTDAKTDVYGIELSGTISKYSATKTGQTATAAFLGGNIYDLTVGANVTVTFIFSDLAYGSELTVEGTIIGTLSTNGTAVINITTGSAGNADNNMFVAAYTGKYVNTISVDKFDKDNLGVTKFELSNLTGLKIEVIESEKKIGKKTYNVYTAQISGSAANKNADMDASIEVSGFIPEVVEGYIPEAGVTIKDTTLAYNATKKKGVTLTIGEVAGEKTSVIVDGKITMGKAEQFVDTAAYAKSSYATYSEGTTTVVYYVSDFVSAVDNIAKAKDKTVKQYGTVDIDGTMEVTAGVITVNGTIDVSGQLTVSGAEINGNGINEVTGKVVKKATATMAAPKEYNVTYTSGTDIAYCGLQTALDESVVGSIIKLNEDVALTKDLTIPAGRTIDTNNYALFVNGTITVNGTLKASGLVTAYAVIVNGTFDSVISGEDDLIVLYDPEDTKTGALTVNGTLRADGNIVVGKTLTVAKNTKFTADNTFVGFEYDGEELSGIAGASADIAGEMTIDGVFFVNGNLTVSGKISITEDLAANGNVKVSGEIASEDDIAFGADEKTVTVTGTVVTEGKITLFGTIDASAGFIAALEYDVENAAAINGAGVILVNNETYPLYTVLTSVARAVELANADIEDEDDAQEVVLMGTLSAGNIQLAERVSLFVVNGAKVTLGTVTMKTSAVEEETIFEAVAVDDGAQLTATVVGTNGATIRLSKAQGLFVNVYSEKVETDVYVNKTRLATEGSTIADSVEIAGGKVVLEGFVYDNTVGEDHKVGTFTVANGATAEGTFTAGVDIIVNINGVLSAENVVVKKILNIAGTVTVVNDGTLTVTEAGSAVDVAGSLVIVAADADNDKAAGIASILKLTVSGKATVAGTLKATTVEVKGTMTVSGQVAGIVDDAVNTLKVSGTMTVNGEKDITVTNLTVIGTVSVADSAKLFANKAFVGTKRTSLAAAASVNALYLTGNNTSAVVYSGATAKVYGENGSDAVFTTVTINGVDYMTAYIPYGSNTTLAQIIPENEFDGIKGIETVDAEGNHVIYEAVKTTVVGSVATKDVKAEVNEAIVRLSAIDHVVIFIDNIRYSNGDIIPGTVGKHTITINIEPGYKGTAKITFNGTSVTDSYTITTSMVSGADVLILSVTGDIQVDPGVEPTPTPEKESEWTVTTILLVVLVILIAVLAIVVILRLNRN